MRFVQAFVFRIFSEGIAAVLRARVRSTCAKGRCIPIDTLLVLARASSHIVHHSHSASRLILVEYWLSFVAGIFGSMHCVGMCGAIILGYSTQGIDSNAGFAANLLAHLTYNAGRVLSYTLVGAMLGLAGGGLSGLQDIGFWFSIVFGLALVGVGISLLKVFPRFSFSTQLNLEGPTHSALMKLYRLTFGALMSVRRLESKFYIGLLTPLLPCGLLYGMFVNAASTGNPLDGALTMFLFGAGIVPALVITGFAGSYFGYRLRAWADKLAALTMILMGVSILWRAMKVGFLTGAHGHL